MLAGAFAILAIDVFYRFQHAFAEVAPACRHRGVRPLHVTRRSARSAQWPTNAPLKAVPQAFDRRIDARVEHFASVNIADISHWLMFVLL